MEFTRKKLKGQNKKGRRTWLSKEKYRIVWRREAFGIVLPPRFQATVCVILPQGGEMWDFVCTRRLFKTFKAAKEACENHERLWTKAAEVTGIRGLQELFGRAPLGFPSWVKSKLNRKVYGLLMDSSAGKKCDLNLDGPMETFNSSSETTGARTQTPGPAFAAKGEDGFTTSRASQPCLNVTPAEELAKAPRKRAGRRTSTPLKPSNKRKRSTTGSSTAKKPLRNSRRKKSKPSGS